jgi:hypothetical protein
MQIKIQIGQDECVFVVKQTNAPQAYDGFGTFAVYEYGPENSADFLRIVLIREEHLSWQLPRYSSGMHTATDCDLITESDVAEILWKRIALREIGHA